MSLSMFVPLGYVTLTDATERLASRKYNDAWVKAQVTPEEKEKFKLHELSSRRQRNGVFYDKTSEERAISTPETRDIASRMQQKSYMATEAWNILRSALITGSFSAYALKDLGQPIAPNAWGHPTCDRIPDQVYDPRHGPCVPLLHETHVEGWIAELVDAHTAVAPTADFGEEIPTVNGEKECQRWLEEAMVGSPTLRPKPRDAFKAEALSLFKISARGFYRAWEKAVEKTGANWSDAGAPKQANRNRCSTNRGT